MRKLLKVAAIAAFAFTLVPASAFAHGNGKNDKADQRGGNWMRKFKDYRKNNRQVDGTVTAVGTSSFTMKAKDGTVYTVNVSSTTKLEKPFNVAITFADIKVNNNVHVKGAVDTNTITASVVVATPQNTHAAKGAGTVTAVSGNTVTLQTNNRGIISNVTVKTDSTTQVVKKDATAGTTADVVVGSKIKVKGLWDELTNVLNAMHIRLK